MIFAVFPLVVEPHHVLRHPAQVGDDEAYAWEEFPLVPLHLGDHPPCPVPGARTVAEVMVEHLRLGGRPSCRSCHEMFYVTVQPAVGLDSYGVEDALLLQVLVDLGRGEGGVSPEVELLACSHVPVHHGLQQVPPAIGGMDVAGRK